MGDRFYFQQQTRGKRRMAVTDEKKAEVIEAYQDAEPTPETSMEIVKEIADDLGASTSSYDIDQGRCLCKKDSRYSEWWWDFLRWYT